MRKTSLLPNKAGRCLGFTFTNCILVLLLRFVKSLTNFLCPFVRRHCRESPLHRRTWGHFGESLAKRRRCCKSLWPLQPFLTPSHTAMNSTLLIFNSVNRTAAAGLWNRSCSCHAVKCLPLLVQSGNCTQEVWNGNRGAERKSDNIWTGTDYWKGKGCVRETGSTGPDRKWWKTKDAWAAVRTRPELGNPSGLCCNNFHLHLWIETFTSVQSFDLDSRWIARKRGPKEGEEPEPKSGEFLLFSRPGDACTVILWMKSATKIERRKNMSDRSFSITQSRGLQTFSRSVYCQTIFFWSGLQEVEVGVWFYLLVSSSS